MPKGFNAKCLEFFDLVRKACDHTDSAFVAKVPQQPDGRQVFVGRPGLRRQVRMPVILAISS